MKENKKYDHIICVCTGKKCKKKGSKEIYKATWGSIKVKNLSENYLVVRTKCLDHCKLGPIVIRNGILETNFQIDQI